MSIVASTDFIISSSCFFFFNDTATTEIYTLSLHDALPIFRDLAAHCAQGLPGTSRPLNSRSEEHTSELQSQSNLVCRLLLEKKKIFHRRKVDYQKEVREKHEYTKGELR